MITQEEAGAVLEAIKNEPPPLPYGIVILHSKVAAKMLKINDAELANRLETDENGKPYIPHYGVRIYMAEGLF